MLRLYQPCLPTRSLKAPTGPLWIHEIKHDGFRIVARRVGGIVRLQTKQGYDYAERYPLIVEAITRLSCAPSTCLSWMGRTIAQSHSSSGRRSYSSSCGRDDAPARSWNSSHP